MTIAQTRPGAGPLTMPVDSDADRAVVGAKAARLARARAAGLPVPDSVVVPCAVSSALLAAAARAAESAGVHRARLELMNDGRAGLAALAQEVTHLGPSLAVRSSSPAEDDPRLTGAFSSLIGVPPADAATAVLSVWASAIRSPGTSGLAPEDSPPEMAVLIQPAITADLAGTAEVRPDGSVQVVATEGPAAALMAGWAPGVTVLVPASGAALPLPPGSPADGAVLAAVARLARDVAGALGDSLIEWAWADGSLWLLQSRCSPDPGGQRAEVTLRGASARAIPGRESGLVMRAVGLAGALGERWLLPWVLAGDETTGFRPGPGAAELAPERGATRTEPDPLRLWHDFTAAADDLTAQAWGIRRAAAGEVAQQLSAALRRGDGPRLTRCPPSPAQAAPARVLARRLMTELWHRGIIRSSREFCALPADLGPVLLGQRAPDASRLAYLAALSWEPALCAAVAAAGRRLAGDPAAPGVGCGPCVSAAEAIRLAGGNGAIPPRPVIVAAYPLPGYAPLLMGAAGLVTRGGSAAAHLVGVARSLGVPAVTGCDLPPGLLAATDPESPLGRARALGLCRPLAAVDGDAGTVCLLGRGGDTSAG